MRFDRLGAFGWVVGYFIIAGTFILHSSLINSLIWGSVGIAGAILFGIFGGRR